MKDKEVKDIVNQLDSLIEKFVSICPDISGTIYAEGGELDRERWDLYLLSDEISITIDSGNQMLFITKEDLQKMLEVVIFFEKLEPKQRERIINLLEHSEEAVELDE